ncbi:MAG: fibronectin type III domain-containing protein [Eubacteriales bacterium]|nr:fibronectin type III domain-containing protein [Eubacteriales bacterium]
MKKITVLLLAFLLVFTNANAQARSVKNFTAEILNPCTVYLSWVGISDKADSFVVAYENERSPYFNWHEIKGTSFTLDWLIPGGKYRFWVGDMDENPEDTMYSDISRYIRLTMPKPERYTTGGFTLNSVELYRHQDDANWLKSKDRRIATKEDSLFDVIDGKAYYSLVLNYNLPNPDKNEHINKIIWVLTTPEGSEYSGDAEAPNGIFKTTAENNSLSFLFNAEILEMIQYSEQKIKNGTYTFSVYFDGKLAAEKKVEW